MRLITAHRILIASAALAALLFSAWAVLSPRAGDGRWVSAVAGLVVAVGLGAYLTTLKRRYEPSGED